MVGLDYEGFYIRRGHVISFFDISSVAGDKSMVLVVSGISSYDIYNGRYNFNKRFNNFMKTSSFNVLRVGLAITFLWVGVLILQSPEAWTGFIKPWAADLLITTPEKTMLGVAIFDIVIGFLLLVDFWTFWASVLAAIHLFLVLIVSGIDAITVRDIGLLAGAMAMAMHLWPESKKIF